MIFNERELLTLREGLFSIRHNRHIIENEEEFISLDNKLCKVVTNNDSKMEIEK